MFFNFGERHRTPPDREQDAGDGEGEGGKGGEAVLRLSRGEEQARPVHADDGRRGSSAGLHGHHLRLQAVHARLRVQSVADGGKERNTYTPSSLPSPPPLLVFCAPSSPSRPDHDMSNRTLLRLGKELKHLHANPDYGVFVAVQEANMTTVKAAILGPEGTPYAYCLFEFLLTFSADYPSIAPICRAQTTNESRTRFNPNIYADGKVCLSILGTWRGERGEGWSSAQGLESVLISVHSLMGSDPYKNEPGYESVTSSRHRDEAGKYVQKIRHESLRIAVIERIERYLGIISWPAFKKDKGWEPFVDLSKRLFLWYYTEYVQIIHKENKTVSVNQAFAKMPFEHPGNTMEGQFNYPGLLRRLEKIRALIDEETTSWQALGRDAVSLQRGVAASLLAQYDQGVQHFAGSPLSVDLSLKEGGNPFVWSVTLFGPPMTQLDGGVFHFTICFSPNFPDTQPRVQFTTPMFHVNITADGIPYYRIQKIDNAIAHVDGVIALLNTEPAVDPRTHLNSEAAGLYWGNSSQKEQYAKKLRRAVTRSVDFF